MDVTKGKRAPKTPAMLRVEEQLGVDIERELRQRYLKDGQSAAQIGRAFNHDPSTIHGWLRRLGIPTRPVSRTGTDES